MANTEVLRQAEELSTASAYYAKAFLVAARICRARAGDTGNTLAEIFEQKARLEDDLRARIAYDPEGTLREEGLL